MKNDNLNIGITLGGYQLTFLKFSCECLHDNMPEHFHGENCYEIHYIPKGRGKLISGGKTYDLFPGVLCMTGPYIEHAQLPDPEDPMVEYCIYLRAEPAARKGESSEEADIRRFLSVPFWYGRNCREMEKLLEQICTELLHPGPAAELMLKALFLQFIVSILRCYDDTPQKPVSSVPVPLIKAHILIEDSFIYEYATITLEELAARLGLSTRQTSRILYRQYGQNFTRKKNEARMAAAETCLRENRLSITEIAEKLGYSCPNHFHAAFRKYYHDTAAHYREKLLREEKQKTEKKAVSKNPAP